MTLIGKTLTSRRIAAAAFWIVVIMLSVNVVRFLSRNLVHAAAPKVVPFTSTLKESATSPTKNDATGVTFFTFALRSDGSTLAKITRNGDSTRMVEFVSKIHVDIKDLRELKSTRSWSGSRTPLLRNPNLNCQAVPAETVVGEESVSGYKAIKLSKGERTSWFAPDYGCALVREVWRFNTGEVSEKTLVSLVVGEPDPTLFYVPNSYREVPPSQLGHSSSADPSCIDCAKPTRPPYDKLDEYYFAHRPTAPPK